MLFFTTRALVIKSVPNSWSKLKNKLDKTRKQDETGRNGGGKKQKKGKKKTTKTGRN